MTRAPNGQTLRIPWLVIMGLLISVLAGLLSLYAWGYTTLDERKADRSVVESMAQDIREIRHFLMGPSRGGREGP